MLKFAVWVESPEETGLCYSGRSIAVYDTQEAAEGCANDLRILFASHSAKYTVVKITEV